MLMMAVDDYSDLGIEHKGIVLAQNGLDLVQASFQSIHSGGIIFEGLFHPSQVIIT